MSVLCWDITVVTEKTLFIAGSESPMYVDLHYLQPAGHKFAIVNVRSTAEREGEGRQNLMIALEPMAYPIRLVQLQRSKHVTYLLMICA